MLAPLSTVLPIFALIFVGWLARRLALLGPTATSEINRFVVWLALPALLFDIVAHASWSELWQPGLIGVFTIGSFAVFGLTIALRLRRPRHLADAAIDALNASYANVGFIGFPLGLATLGQAALAPTLIISIITVCVIFAVAIVLIEIGLQTEARRHHLVLKVARSLAKNPLLVSPVLGALVPLCHLTVPGSAEVFLKLLGGAASPCALVALGLFLAAKRETAENEVGAVSLLVVFKLLLQPVLTWALARFVFGLSPFLTHTAVLLAALPTGTGPFMLAEFYRREASVTSNTILVSTIVSVVTVSAYLAMIG